MIILGDKKLYIISTNELVIGKFYLIEFLAQWMYLKIQLGFIIE